jgi:hypothetical protein
VSPCHHSLWRFPNSAPSSQEINDIEALVKKAAALVENQGKGVAFAEWDAS